MFYKVLDWFGVPVAVQAAARRAFLRTAADAMSTSALLTGGIAIAFTGDALTALGVAAGSAVAGALFAGAQAWFRMIAKGIPDEYAAAGDPEFEAEPEFEV